MDRHPRKQRGHHHHEGVGGVGHGVQVTEAHRLTGSSVISLYHEIVEVVNIAPQVDRIPLVWMAVSAPRCVIEVLAGAPDQTASGQHQFLHPTCIILYLDTSVLNQRCGHLTLEYLRSIFSSEDRKR